MERISNKLKKGDKLIYPSSNGVALICRVEDWSRLDVLVSINERRFFIPKQSVDEHAILLSGEKAKIYVTQQLIDDDHALIYMRYRHNETFWDRLYNRYCRIKGRDKLPSRPISPRTVTVEMELEV